MSAYIVENVTIDKILSLIRQADYDYHWPNNNSWGLSRMGYNATKKSLERLGQDMLDMNTRAVNCRYKEKTQAESYPCFNARIVTTLEGLKALNCFLYQCSEGDVPESDLYKALDEMRNQIALSLIHKMPEYDAAMWG